ncbi:TetR/AcrR family transcriptional regulator [Arthrobacter rhizosphaerae]|uniref:TetR/AcrR family transcriptional regulator n=1 Tax=Arthrobacter rhizosphaerae TaxID=2855490 RepID=UPI001FF40451|nr:TetR/AcrR family transcriptional regulator [Arthrobacter rhizosphaerae]
MKILETCIEMFGQTGFHSMTMKEVAQRVGISNTGLLHHFASKDELLFGVLGLDDERRKQFFLERGLAVMSIPDDVDEIKSLLKTLVTSELQPGLIELHSTLAAEAASPDHPAHESYRNRYANVVRYYTQAFQALAAAGEMKTDAEPEAVAGMFVALTDGLQLQWLYERDTLRLERNVSAFLRSFVKGID